MSISDRFASWAPRILGALRIISGALFACYGAFALDGLMWDGFSTRPPPKAAASQPWTG
jgi:hypothetical protein